MQFEIIHKSDFCHHHCSQEAALQMSVRVNPNNPNHHLWNNNGTWWVHYTVAEPGCSGTRRRASLRTDSVVRARRLRDALFVELGTKPGRGVS